MAVTKDKLSKTILRWRIKRVGVYFRELMGLFSVPFYTAIITFYSSSTLTPSGVTEFLYYCAFTLIFAIAKIDGRKGWQLVTLTAMAMLTVIAFGNIYHSFEPLSGEHDFRGNYRDAIYFSIVTFTTLGYGDITPPSGLKLVAASQAILGYIYLGLFVAGAMELINEEGSLLFKRKPAKKEKRHIHKNARKIRAQKR